MDRAALDSQSRASARPLAALGFPWPALTRREWLLLSVAVAGAIVLGAILVTDGFRRASELSEAQQWEAHSLDVIATAERTRSEIRNMQRGQRGYLITSEEQYLQPYSSGRQNAKMELSQLRRLTQDNREQTATLQRLTEHFAALDARLSSTIAAKRAGRQSDVLALVKSGQGEIGRLDTDVDGMIAVENRLLRQRR